MERRASEGEEELVRSRERGRKGVVRERAREREREREERERERAMLIALDSVSEYITKLVI